MQPIENLIVKSADLARSTPEQWRAFLTALAAYSETQRDKLLSSPVESFQVQQGQAKMLATLCDEFAKCTETADKIARKATQ